MKITIASMNLSTNCTNRCLRLGQALAPHYEVEIVGPTFGIGNNWGKGIWPPLEKVDIPIRSVAGDIMPMFVKSIWNLLKIMDGDVIIACKPRFPSFGVALVKRALSGTPVILDIDDDELAQTLPAKSFRLRRKLSHTHEYQYTSWVHRLHSKADAIFTVSENFRKTYGGVIVPHGMDPYELDPAKFNRETIRQELGIKPSDIIIGFVGTPNPHKGIDLILKAMQVINRPELKLMIVGAEPEDDYVKFMNQQYGRHLILIPQQPLELIPYFLSANDLVVLPQRNCPETFGQMPAKLTDAMAMGKTVIAAARADIPKYLEGRGLLFDAENLEELISHLAWCLNNQFEAQQLGEKARIYFLNNLTLNAMFEAMEPSIKHCLNQ